MFSLRENHWTIQVNRHEESQLKEWREHCITVHTVVILKNSVTERCYPATMVLKEQSREHIWTQRHFQEVHEENTIFVIMMNHYLPVSLIFSRISSGIFQKLFVTLVCTQHRHFLNLLIHYLWNFKYLF